MVKLVHRNLKDTKVNKPAIGIVGAGGFGSEVMPLLKKTLLNTKEIGSELYFIDSDKNKIESDGVKILSEEDFMTLNNNTKYFNIAIANSTIRERLSLKFEEKSVEPFGIISDESIFLRNVEFGKGCIVFPNSVFTSNIEVGNFFHSYHFVSVAHDCRIGNFVTIAPGALINGNVTIGDHAYVGSGAVIKQGVSVGSNAMIGMGSVVIDDVESGTTVAGNPAKLIKTITR